MPAVLADNGRAMIALPPRQSLKAFFEPRAVAVVGAGRTRGGVGAEILHNLLEGFTGPVYAVNPHAVRIESAPAFPSVGSIPGGVDLAIVAVPGPAVEAVVDDCLRSGVTAIVVISAGFGETGEEGLARERRLAGKVRAAGARMIGPNCMGLVNTDPAFHLNATFSPAYPPGGQVAFSSQSGALGLAILEHARDLNLGLSAFVSVGNKADVSSNDLIEYWDEDPRTSVILLYVESFGNPRRFGRIARRVGRRKPIVAVKAGRSSSGARAALSHTGALAASDRVVDALFKESGVIRTETLEELFDAATLLSHQPLPAGRRVAILTNAGGPGILAADACEARGLEVPPLAPETRAALAAFLPKEAGLSNPVDMIATAPASAYARAIPVVLADPGIDALLTIFTPPLVTDTTDAARAIAAAARGAGKPVLATFFGAIGVPDILSPIPCYTFPESAARALAHAVGYAEWRRRPIEVPAMPADIDRDRAAAVVAAAIAAGTTWLSPPDGQALLEAARIPLVPTRTVTDEAEAVAAAATLGYPVVLKGVGPTIVHKTEAGAVRTGLADEAAVRGACRDFAARAAITSMVVQPMVAGGVEMIVGASLDPTFGHVVVCGAGGTLVEILQDTTCRLTPVALREAGEMIDELHCARRLRGFRGAPPLDEPGLRDIIQRVSALVDTCPEIVELDLNPVIVTATGVHVVDVRVRVRPLGPPARPSRPR